MILCKFVVFSLLYYKIQIDDTRNKVKLNIRLVFMYYENVWPLIILIRNDEISYIKYHVIDKNSMEHLKEER